jgi:hypothetical protein
MKEPPHKPSPFGQRTPNPPYLSRSKYEGQIVAAVFCRNRVAHFPK